MVNPSLRNVNLNLIPVLRALLQEGSVSQAAAVLGRSPSAISAALAQLRTALQDPLFVRIGGRLQPTARAAALAEPLDALYRHLESFFKSDAFQPEQSDRKFVVASPDIMIYSIGPQLVRTLREQAPGMSIHFLDVGSDLTDAMAMREIDFALLPKVAIASLAPAPLRYLDLQSFPVDTALMSSNHPLAGRKLLSETDLLNCKRIGFRPDPALLKTPTPSWLDSATFEVVVSQLLPIPYLLEGTDLVAVVTKSMAQSATSGRSLVALDLETPYVLDTGLAWSPVFDADPAHAWFRNAVAGKNGLPGSATET